MSSESPPGVWPPEPLVEPWKGAWRSTRVAAGLVGLGAVLLWRFTFPVTWFGPAMLALMLIALGAFLQSVALLGSFVRLGTNLRHPRARVAFRVGTGLGVVLAGVGLGDAGTEVLPVWMRAAGLTVLSAFWVVGSPLLAPREHRQAAVAFSLAMAAAIGLLLVAHLSR